MQNILENQFNENPALVYSQGRRSKKEREIEKSEQALEHEKERNPFRLEPPLPKQDFDNFMNDVIETQEEIALIFPKNIKQVQTYSLYAQQLAKDQLNEIFNIKNINERTFHNTIRRLDNIQRNFYKVLNFISVQSMVSPDKNLRDACHEQSIILSKFAVDTFMNKKLFQAYNDYKDNIGKYEWLSDEQEYFMQELEKQFKRGGYHLPDKEFDEVKKLQSKISEISLQFEQNIASDKSLIKVNESDLQGLNPSFINGLKKEDDKYLLGCDYPTYFEIMQNCQVEDTRRNLYITFNNRAYPQNVSLLEELINLRDQLAKKLGFESYAALDIDNAMCKNVETVQSFLNELVIAAKDKSQEEFELLTKQLPDGITLSTHKKIKPWDYSYITNQYKKKYYQVDETKLSEYFPAEKTTKGLLNIYEKFFNLEFKQVKPVYAWHEDVEMIEVYDKKKENKLLGYIYLDLYPRENKYSHACCVPMIPGQQKFEYNQPKLSDIPYIGLIIANFPKSTSEKPALLKHADVQTFFHEFGHIMHGVLSRTELAGFAGTNTKMDFVETPSQMFEGWMDDKEMLKQIGSHYLTNELLPDDLIDKKLQLKKFLTGHFLTRQAYLSQVSLDLYKTGCIKNTDNIIKDLYQKIMPYFEYAPEIHFQASFGHLTGYGAQYYGYMWSKVYADDCFEEIKKKGLLNQEVAQRLRKEVLEKGGSVDPVILMHNFLQRDVNKQNFYKNLGFNVTDEKKNQ